jgi:hypothetical protein
MVKKRSIQYRQVLLGQGLAHAAAGAGRRDEGEVSGHWRKASIINRHRWPSNKSCIHSSC